MLYRALWQPDWFLRGYKAPLQLRALWQTDWFLQWYKAPLQLRCALYIKDSHTVSVYARELAYRLHLVRLPRVALQ